MGSTFRESHGRGEKSRGNNDDSDHAWRAGTEPELKVRGAVLLLVACGGSNFRLSCLTANEFLFIYFFLCFLCVHPSLDKIILFKIF